MKKTRDYTLLTSRLDRALDGTGTVSALGEFAAKNTTYALQKIVLGAGNPRRVLISAGIHGDEPAGIECIHEFLANKIYKSYLPDWEITLLPCLNPTGYETNRRNNHSDRDLNRLFKATQEVEEVALIQSAFSAEFDLSIELHEDEDSPGYYLYQKSATSTGVFPGNKILDSVANIAPINNRAEIEGLPADNGVIHKLSEPHQMDWWPMAVYSWSRGTKLCLTLESPPHLPMATRVQAHLVAIDATINLCSQADQLNL